MGMVDMRSATALRVGWESRNLAEAAKNNNNNNMKTDCGDEFHCLCRAATYLLGAPQLPRLLLCQLTGSLELPGRLRWSVKPA